MADNHAKSIALLTNMDSFVSTREFISLDQIGDKLPGDIQNRLIIWMAGRKKPMYGAIPVGIYLSDMIKFMKEEKVFPYISLKSNFLCLDQNYPGNCKSNPLNK